MYRPCILSYKVDRLPCRDAIEYASCFLEKTYSIIGTGKPDVVEKAIKHVYSVLEYVLSSGRVSRLAREITRYIGLGVGSTPSFDDYVVGVVITYNLFSKIYGLERLVLPLNTVCQRTSYISCKSIEYALRLDIISTIDKLFIDLLEGVYDRVASDIVDLVCMGGDSGYYMARGLLDTIGLFKKVFNNS